MWKVRSTRSRTTTSQSSNIATRQSGCGFRARAVCAAFCTTRTVVDRRLVKHVKPPHASDSVSACASVRTNAHTIAYMTSDASAAVAGKTHSSAHTKRCNVAIAGRNVIGGLKHPTCNTHAHIQERCGLHFCTAYRARRRVEVETVSQPEDRRNKNDHNVSVSSWVCAIESRNQCRSYLLHSRSNAATIISAINKMRLCNLCTAVAAHHSTVMQ